MSVNLGPSGERKRIVKFLRRRDNTHNFELQQIQYYFVLFMHLQKICLCVLLCVKFVKYLFRDEAENSLTIQSYPHHTCV